MKYIKTYENINEDAPQVDDYVICEEYSDERELDIFLANNIGKIVDIEKNTYFAGIKDIIYWVKYDSNIGEELETSFNFGKYMEKNTRPFDKKEIKYWSKNKEELEHIISANKYNL